MREYFIFKKRTKH